MTPTDSRIYSSSKTLTGDTDKSPATLVFIAKGYFHDQPYKEQKTSLVVWPESRFVTIEIDNTVHMMAEENYKPFLTWAAHNNKSMLMKSLWLPNMGKLSVT